VFKMGDTVETALGSKITVYGWTTDVPTRQGNEFITPRAGTVFSQAEIKLCPRYVPSTPTHGYDLAPSFSLVMSDHTVVAPDNSGYTDEFQANDAVIGPNSA
jgi:hypothetical protein